MRKSFIGSIKLNPLQLVAALFILLSSFLTWVTLVSIVIVQNIVVFGVAVQSNLLEVYTQQLGTNISESASSGALYSMILLVLGGLITLKSIKVGLPIAMLGVLSFFLPFYPIFGAKISGTEQTFISPGIGFFCASIGVGLGLASSKTRREALSVLLSKVRRGRGLAKVGVFVGSVALTLDFLNHLALGQLPAFLGFGILAESLHVGLVVGIASALLIVVLGIEIFQDRWLVRIAVATLLLLAFDATYNVLNGSLEAFLGHNFTEIILHVSIYYGVALLTLSRFLPRK